MPVFHELAVAGLEPLTDDAVRVALAVPDPLRAEYLFSAGQHLTFALDSEVGPVRRTYSICSTPAAYEASGELSVGVKILPDGVFSRLVAERLRIGDRLRVMTPAGRFSARSRLPSRDRTSMAIVAGSGITPVLSIMATLLETEQRSRFVLVYGSRRAGSVMFAEEIADLKDRFTDRLQIFHLISGEVQAAPLLSGRIDAERLDTILRLLPSAEIDEWFVCGPLGLIETTSVMLAARGVPPDLVHREVFFTGQVPDLRPRARLAQGKINFRLDGRTSTVDQPPAGSVLDAVLTARPDAPFACRNGVCGTCRMRVLSGTVEMAQNFALEPHDLAAGFRLACQSVPSSAMLEVDFDS